MVKSDAGEDETHPVIVDAIMNMPPEPTKTADDEICLAKKNTHFLSYDHRQYQELSRGKIKI